MDVFIHRLAFFVPNGKEYFLRQEEDGDNKYLRLTMEEAAAIIKDSRGKVVCAWEGEKRMKSNNKMVALGAVVLAVLVAVLAAVWFNTRPATSEGEKTITVEVVHKDGSKKTFTCATTEEFLAPVLVNEKIVEDDPYETGMFFVVDSEKAAYEEDQSYWAVLQNGEYAQLGITELPIQNGDAISLVYTVYTGG